MLRGQNKRPCVVCAVQKTSCSTMHGFENSSILPVFSSRMRRTRLTTRYVPPQYLTISASNHSPRVLLCVSSVARISGYGFTRTHSPGCKPSTAVGVFSHVPLRRGNGVPPRREWNQSEREVQARAP